MLLCKNDMCVYFGELNAVAHAHYAIEISLAPDSPLHLHIDSNPPRAFQACIISPNTQHQIITRQNNDKITIMIDADSIQARALNTHYNLNTKKYCFLKLKDINRHVNNILETKECATTSNCNALFNALTKLIDSLLPPDYRKLVKPLDKRIEIIKDYIEENVKLKQFSYTDLAAKVRLSEYYLSHLFKKEIGIPLRKYVLWKRVKTSAFEAQDGLSITQAASSAGFTDVSHLTKVYFNMLGLKPNMILRDFK